MGSSKSRLKRFMRLERIWISLEPDVILFSKIIIRQNANFIRLISGCRWFLSLVGQKFRERARKFPAIFNECTIDWFLPWPEEALSVAESFIKNFKGLETTAEVKIELFKHIGTVYLMVFVTPKSFLNYLNSIKISICLNSVNWIS